MANKQNYNTWITVILQKNLILFIDYKRVEKWSFLWIHNKLQIYARNSDYKNKFTISKASVTKHTKIHINIDH
jgi:hypothetical protein